MSVPKVAKVIINIGMGEASQNVKLLDVAVIELGQIAGPPARARAVCRERSVGAGCA